MRPTICTGAQEMLDFYTRQLSPLKQKTSGTTDEGANAARMQARIMVARARAAWDRGPEANTVSNDGELNDSQVAPPLDLPSTVDLTSVPDSLPELLHTVSEVMLPRNHVGYIRAETQTFDKIVRAREAMSADAAGEAPPYVRDAVFRAFRAIEIAYYDDLRRRRFDVYNRAIFGLIEATRKAHLRNCTCEP